TAHRALHRTATRRSARRHRRHVPLPRLIQRRLRHRRNHQCRGRPAHLQPGRHRPDSTRPARGGGILMSSTTEETTMNHRLESERIAIEVGEQMLVERRKVQHRETTITWTLRLVTLVVFLGVWALASRRGWIDPLMISA